MMGYKSDKELIDYKGQKIYKLSQLNEISNFTFFPGDLFYLFNLY